REQVQERALARAAGAEQPDEFAFPDLERDPVHGAHFLRGVAVDQLQVPGVQHQPRLSMIVTGSSRRRRPRTVAPAKRCATIGSASETRKGSGCQSGTGIPRGSRTRRRKASKTRIASPTPRAQEQAISPAVSPVTMRNSRRCGWPIASRIANSSMRWAKKMLL